MNSFKIAVVIVSLMVLGNVSAFACAAHSGGDSDSSQAHGDKPANG